MSTSIEGTEAGGLRRRRPVCYIFSISKHVNIKRKRGGRNIKVNERSARNRVNSGYARPTSFSMPARDMGRNANAPPVKKLPKTVRQETYYGEYFGSTLDGTRWYLIPLDEMRPYSRCTVNRVTKDGHVVVVERRFGSRSAAEKYIREQREMIDNFILDQKLGLDKLSD